GNLTDYSVRPAVEANSSTPLVVGISVTVLALVLLALFPSGGSSSPAPVPVNPVKRALPPPPPPDPGPSPEEKRRTEAAKQAVSKAIAFAQANPKDVEGQTLAWRTALLE